MPGDAFAFLPYYLEDFLFFHCIIKPMARVGSRFLVLEMEFNSRCPILPILKSSYACPHIDFVKLIAMQFGKKQWRKLLCGIVHKDGLAALGDLDHIPFSECSMIRLTLSKQLGMGLFLRLELLLFFFYPIQE